MPVSRRSAADGTRSQRRGPNGRTARDRAAHALSAAAAVSAAAAAVAGLLVDGVYGEPASVSEMLRGYDLVTLTLAAPALAVALSRARRGSDRARLVWIGVLAYLVYTYAFLLVGTSFNDLFLWHTAVFGCSVFALVLTLSALDAESTAGRFHPRTPRRSIAAVLGVLSVALGAMWIAAVLRHSLTGEVPAGSALVEPELVVRLGIALDLALLVPSYALAALLLWRAAPWGYALAGLCLVSGVLHQVGYLVAMPFQAVAGVPGAAVTDPLEPVIVLLYAGAAAALLWGAGHARPAGRARRDRAAARSDREEAR